MLWDGSTPEALTDFHCDLAINYFHCTLAVGAVLIQTSVSVCFLWRHPTLIHISTQITPLSTAALSTTNRTGTLDQLSDSHQLITSHSSPTSMFGMLCSSGTCFSTACCLPINLLVLFFASLHQVVEWHPYY